MRSAYTQKRVHGDDSGTDIQRGFRRAGNPVFFGRNQLFHAIQDRRFIDLGYAQAPAGAIQPFQVFLGPEQLDTAGIGPICLEPFKNPLAVV